MRNHAGLRAAPAACFQNGNAMLNVPQLAKRRLRMFDAFCFLA
jgi:hypothetical protein